MRYTLLVLTTFSALSSFAQQAQPLEQLVPPAQIRTVTAQPTQPQRIALTTQAPANSCIAVRSIGSHAARNIFFFGVAGALISKQQYEVVDAVNYPAHIQQKFHGNDLQTIEGNGTKVVVLDKHFTGDDLHKACR